MQHTNIALAMVDEDGKVTGYFGGQISIIAIIDGVINRNENNIFYWDRAW